MAKSGTPYVRTRCMLRALAARRSNPPHWCLKTSGKQHGAEERIVMWRPLLGCVSFMLATQRSALSCKLVKHTKEQFGGCSVTQ